MLNRSTHFLSVVLTALVVFGASSVSASAALPVNYDGGSALLWSVAHPGAAPAGANDFGCRPSAAHPRPVVLIHGTFENQGFNWYALSPLLKNSGYCVFTFDFGGTSNSQGYIYGIDHVATSAGQLSSFVDRVLTATGTSKVDLVGHSQGGGVMPRWYLKFLGGATKVNSLVGLGASNHGATTGIFQVLETVAPGVSNWINGWCLACADQATGSSVNTAVDSGGDTVAGVKYTVIATKYDEVVSPYQHAFLSGSGVQNITLQNGCPLNLSEHLALSFDRRALAYVRNALDPAHPVSVPCVLTLPIAGG
jgi:triacylglycerol esterase/lipase EstA (alpha/beta hydrolase family)